MAKPYNKLLTLLFIFFQLNNLIAQPNSLHLSLFPGISNTAESERIGNYKLSLNLTSSITNSVHGIEISGVSNHNYEKFNGIQLSGFTNQSGFKNRLEPKNKVDYTFRGFQVASISNKTYGKGAGVQLALFNSALSSFEGAQAGLINSSESITGVQISAFMNVSRKGFIGFQVAPLFNYSGGQSTGLQLALFNYSRTAGLDFKNKGPLTSNWQIGLINFSKYNHGNQIGIINISESNDGVPIGLLNIDASEGNVSFRSTDMYISNLSISTGSPFFTNLLQVGYNFSISGLPSWGISYGFEKEWANIENTRLIATNVSIWQQKVKNFKLFQGPRIIRWEVIYALKLGKFRFIEFGTGIGIQLNQPKDIESSILAGNKRVFPALILGIR